MKLEPVPRTESADSPRKTTTPQIISHIRLVYKHLYTIGKKLQKGDKLGIHQVVEQKILHSLELAITAVYSTPANKKIHLETLRIQLGICQHLLRTEYELSIISEKSYIHITGLLIEISKQTNGWIKYVSK
jgi:hypothetical protein